MTAETCRHVKDDGVRCAVHFALKDGLCPAHAPGGAEHMREVSRLGGAASAAKSAGVAFQAEEVTRIETLEDAKAALDTVRVAVLTRRITHAEGNAASKAVSEWVKTEGVAATGRLVTELHRELAAKTEEIDALRRQLATPLRPRVAK